MVKKAARIMAAKTFLRVYVFLRLRASKEVRHNKVFTHGFNGIMEPVPAKTAVCLGVSEREACLCERESEKAGLLLEEGEEGLLWGEGVWGGS